jgi:hypothetical protein
MQAAYLAKFGKRLSFEEGCVARYYSSLEKLEVAMNKGKKLKPVEFGIPSVPPASLSIRNNP